MATTPIWVPLVVAFIGLGSVMLTQHLANRREEARWQREREREQASWAREDAARSYEDRRAAYVDFIKDFNQRWNHYIAATEEMRWGQGNDEPPPDYLDPLYGHLVQIQVFGTKEAAKLAEEAFSVLSGGVFFGKQVSHDVLSPLQSEVRRDLSIPSLAEDRTGRSGAEG